MQPCYPRGYLIANCVHTRPLDYDLLPMPTLVLTLLDEGPVGICVYV